MYRETPQKTGVHNMGKVVSECIIWVRLKGVGEVRKEMVEGPFESVKTKWLTISNEKDPKI